MDFSELRKAVEEVELVDGHAHNLVALDSNFSFIHAFSLAHGDAVAFSPHSLSFKVTASSAFLTPWSITLLEERFLLVLDVCVCSFTLINISNSQSQ